MRRWAWIVRPPCTRLSRCFPREMVSRTTFPVRSAVAKRGTLKSLRVSVCPVSAASSWRAVRQTTSPSGIGSGQARLAQRDVQPAAGQPDPWFAGAGDGLRDAVIGQSRRAAEDEEVAGLQLDVPPWPTAVLAVAESEDAAGPETERDDRRLAALGLVRLHAHPGPSVVEVDQRHV